MANISLPSEGAERVKALSDASAPRAMKRWIPLAGAMTGSQPGLDQPHQFIQPDPGRQDHPAGIEGDLLRAETIAHDYPVMAGGRFDRLDRSVVGQPRAERGRGLGDLDGEARIVGQGVKVLVGAARPAIQQRRKAGPQPLPRNPHVAGMAAEPAHQVVGREADPQLRRRPGSAVEREHKREFAHQAGRQLAQPTPLVGGFLDKIELEVAQVAQAAVDQLRGPRRRAAPEVARFHQPG